ncbi:unnamed protein product [Nezara viridula]|uniref:Cytosol aminopeptidase domain-containing protein n=1 Tax=Nezara viridula TaxID=85310 RepID=A0A9P0H0V7_NEZVI|nr:unnamed protein product [Nezara viridula]
MSLGYEVQAVPNVKAIGFDGILLISYNALSDEAVPQELKDVIKEASALDDQFEEEVSIHKVDLPAKRLFYSPTGPISPEYHDVRCFSEAARKGITRAVKAGVKAPLLVLGKYPTFPQSQLVSLLGVMEGLYVNLQYREDCPIKYPKVNKLGVLSPASPSSSRLISVATALETGRIVARDIGGPDPERMTPQRVEQYVKETFPTGGNVKVEVVSDENTLKKEYPLFSAVNRAASEIERHKGRIVYLTYEGSNVTDTLLIVGKGVTYDTGGADIKVGGAMLGMCRDKCGAAAAAGFMKVVSILKPENLKVVAGLSLVRNSCGENSYVADEIITSRAGKRIRIVNTDAEGRMAMADVLCYMKDIAKKAVNPHLFTIATLTGHAFRTVGNGYTIALDNGPARQKSFAQLLQKTGEIVGDMFEVSTIRREDYEAYKGKTEGEDVVQAESLPSAQCKRGHQGPAAFLILASGLEKHGLDSTDGKLYYTHLDIAASAGAFPEQASGCPVLGLAANYLSVHS